MISSQTTGLTMQHGKSVRICIGRGCSPSRRNEQSGSSSTTIHTRLLGLPPGRSPSGGIRARIIRTSISAPLTFGEESPSTERAQRRAVRQKSKSKVQPAHVVSPSWQPVRLEVSHELLFPSAKLYTSGLAHS